MPSTKHAPIPMIRGRGGPNAVTHYSCGAVDKAKKLGVKLIVIGKNGKEELAEPRTVHRPELLGQYCDTHKKSGEGKYINSKAFPQGNQRVVVGAQYINPYLREQGPYYSAVEVFLNSIGKRRLAQCSSQVAQGFIPGTHLLWDGKRNADGFLPGVASEWMNKEDLWKQAIEISPELQKILRKSKSGRKDIKVRKTAQEKFFDDINVLRRATVVVDISTGEREYRGGKTPYSKPLEQMGFAIDKRYLTYGVDEDGEELAQHYYRMVVGRSEPHVLRKAAWTYEGVDSKIAFKDEAARRKYRQATRQIQRATAA